MSETKPNAPIWLKVFVGFHLICITLWALPNPSQGVQEGKIQPTKVEQFLVWNFDNPKQFGPLRTYLFTSGFCQYWYMFFPNPATMDLCFYAEV